MKIKIKVHIQKMEDLKDLNLQDIMINNKMKTMDIMIFIINPNLKCLKDQDKILKGLIILNIIMNIIFHNLNQFKNIQINITIQIIKIYIKIDKNLKSLQDQNKIMITTDNKIYKTQQDILIIMMNITIHQDILKIKCKSLSPYQNIIIMNHLLMDLKIFITKNRNLQNHKDQKINMMMNNHQEINLIILNIQIMSITMIITKDLSLQFHKNHIIP